MLYLVSNLVEKVRLEHRYALNPEGIRRQYDEEITNANNDR